MKVTAIETLACDAGWRNYHFVKLTTDQGIVGWSEFSEDFGSPGIGAVIRRLTAKVVGQTVGAGHFAQLIVPDQVNAMIARFLATAGPA